MKRRDFVRHGAAGLLLPAVAKAAPLAVIGGPSARAYRQADELGGEEPGGGEEPPSELTPTTMQSSVTQYGVTWTFDQAYPVGQYCNGDYFVVGPVVITSITPASNTAGRVMHGCEVNLTIGSQQGYDTIGNSNNVPFNAAKNKDPGYTGQALAVSTGSVVKAISKASPAGGTRPILDTLAILTVVDEVPPAGAFRPPPYGTDKTARWFESQLNYEILQSLTPVGTHQSLATQVTNIRRFWNEQATSWVGRALHPESNQPDYGREIQNTLGQALLTLHLNYSPEQKRDLFVHMVQKGLDIFGARSIGASWNADGGHNPGRKMPMLLAGLALNDSAILLQADGTANRRFQEDQQTFYVSQADVDLARYTADGRRRDPYTSEMIGMPEWGEKHYNTPNRDGSNWDAYYREIGSGFVAHCLCAHLTPGAVEAWNWPAYFDYVDRYVSIGSPLGGANGIPSFSSAMWNAYRNP